MGDLESKVNELHSEERDMLLALEERMEVWMATSASGAGGVRRVGQRPDWMHFFQLMFESAVMGPREEMENSVWDRDPEVSNRSDEEEV